MPHFAFISYSKKDQETAEAICRALEAQGVQCWYAARDITGGASWTASIMDALGKSGVMIVVWSSASNDSKEVRREVQHAFKKNVPVIPFRIEDFVPAKELEYYLDSVQWLDATPPDLKQHLQRLVAQVRMMVPPRSQAAASREPQLAIQAAAKEAELPSAPEPGSVGRSVVFAGKVQDVAAAEKPPEYQNNQADGWHEDVEEPPTTPALPGSAILSQFPKTTIPEPWPRPKASSTRASARVEYFGPFARMQRSRGCVISGSVAFMLALTVTVLVYRHDENSGWQDTQRNREIDIANGVASRVNGKPIMRSEVDRAVNQQAGERSLTTAELEKARLQMLENLIEREALLQRAENENLIPTDQQVTASIQQQKQQASMTDEEFRRSLTTQGLTLESFWKLAQTELAIKDLQNKYAGRITVSDAEVADYYNRHQELFVRKGGVGLADIVADPADNGVPDDARSDAEAKQKIHKIYRQLRSGADFRTVARSRSEDLNRARDGDIGFATKEDLKNNGFPEDLIKKFDSISIGDITAPVRFANGRWYIFKLTERRQASENLTLESPDVRAQVTNSLIDQKKQTANAELLKSAMNDVKIVNYLANNSTPTP